MHFWQCAPSQRSVLIITLFSSSIVMASLGQTFMHFLHSGQSQTLYECLLSGLQCPEVPTAFLPKAGSPLQLQERCFQSGQFFLWSKGLSQFLGFFYEGNSSSTCDPLCFYLAHFNKFSCFRVNKVSWIGFHFFILPHLSRAHAQDPARSGLRSPCGPSHSLRKRISQCYYCPFDFPDIQVNLLSSIPACSKVNCNPISRTNPPIFLFCRSLTYHLSRLRFLYNNFKKDI